VLASIVYFHDNSSVSLVLSVDNTIFGVLLIQGNRFCDLRFLLIHMGLEMFLTCIKSLNEDLSVGEEIKEQLLLFRHVLICSEVISVVSIEFSHECVLFFKSGISDSVTESLRFLNHLFNEPNSSLLHVIVISLNFFFEGDHGVVKGVL